MDRHDLNNILKEEGIYPGMQKKNVDCQGIVKALRKEYNDIVWVSASLDGSRLKIQIKENEDAFPIISSTQPDKSNKTDPLPADLVASTDGIITKLITRTGIPQVHIGDSVTKGTYLYLGGLTSWMTVVKLPDINIRMPMQIFSLIHRFLI